MRVRVAALVGLLLVLCGRLASAEVVTWTIGGETREAIVFVPSAPAPGGKMPVIFSFHGHGDDMDNFQYTGLHMFWLGGIVVYF